MTFEQYWQRLIEKNPGLRDDSAKMTISVTSFRRSMQQAFDTGQDSIRGRVGRVKPGDLMRDVFGDMF